MAAESKTAEPEFDTAERGGWRRRALVVLVAVPLVVVPLLLFGGFVVVASLWEPQIGVDDSTFKPFPAEWSVLHEYEEGCGQGRGPEFSQRVLLLQAAEDDAAVEAVARHFRERGYRRTVPRLSDSYLEVTLDGAAARVALAHWPVYRDLSLLRRTPTEDEDRMLAAAGRHDAESLVVAFVQPDGC